MSMATKRPHAEALADALAFRAMFRHDSYERWEIAGSVRRGKVDVGDVEHVVIPKVDVVAAGLFGGDGVRVNLVWQQLDRLVGVDTVAKHVYPVNKADGTTTTRNMWGERYRGVDFNGFNHEIFIAEPDNFGCIFLIRTGPAEFSERIVTRIKAGGMYRQQGGFLVHVQSGDRVPMRDERAYLKIAGISYIEPGKR